MDFCCSDPNTAARLASSVLSKWSMIQLAALDAVCLVGICVLLIILLLFSLGHNWSHMFYLVSVMYLSIVHRTQEEADINTRS